MVDRRTPDRHDARRASGRRTHPVRTRRPDRVVVLRIGPRLAQASDHAMSKHARSDLISEGRISIESWLDAHIESITQWIRPDAEWKKWDGPYFPAPSASARDAMAERLAQDPWQRDAATGLPKRLATCVDGYAVGSVSWHWEDPTSGWVRVGIVIYDPAYWGDGHGTNALRMWIDWLAAQDPVHRIDLVTWSGNEVDAVDGVLCREP